jgi:hypothetical protein
MNTQNTHFEVLNVKQAAEFLQMSPRFIQDHAEEIGGVSLGGSDKRAGRWRFTRDALLNFVKRSGRRRDNVA